MITAPSTINPKSMAPRLIRLPESPAAFITITANKSESGMVIATTRPARTSPSKSNSTATTSSAPSSRLVPTVRMVRATSAERS